MGLPPKASRARRGKAFMARATARTPSSSSIIISSSNPQGVPLSIPGAKPPRCSLRLPPLRLELVGTRLPLEPAAPAASTEKDDDYAYFRVTREKVAPVDTGRTEMVQHHVSERWAAKCRTSPSISSSAAASTRVAAVSWRFRHHFIRACLGLATWRGWRYERRCGGNRTAFRGADAACRGAGRLLR